MKWLFLSDLQVFSRLFFVQPLLSGEDYFVAPEAAVKAMKAEMCRKKKFQGPCDGLSFRDVLPDGDAMRLELFQRRFEEQMQVKGVDPANYQWPIYDTNQPCPMRTWEDSTLHTILTDGMHFSLNPKINRPLMGQELLLTQGIPMRFLITIAQLRGCGLCITRALRVCSTTRLREQRMMCVWAIGGREPSKHLIKLRCEGVRCPYTLPTLSALRRLNEKQLKHLAGQAFNIEI
eukprot:11571835-Karenia_brevis.AAC.1